MSRMSSPKVSQIRVLNWVSPIVERAQEEKHAQLLQELTEIAKKTDAKTLAKVLFRVMVVPFASKEKSAYAERLIKFYHAAVTADSADRLSSAETRRDCLSHRTLAVCCKFHTDTRVQVRMRIVDLVGVILGRLTSANNLEDYLKTIVQEMLLSRLKDRSPQVRARSAAALKYLIEKEGISETVSSELSFHLKWDPHQDVRKAALQSLQESSQDLEFILEKINDLNDTIRKLAFLSIGEKVGIDALSVPQRQRILRLGLNDKSEKVRKAVSTVLTGWATSCNNDYILLLSKLDLPSNRRLCTSVLTTLLKAGDAAAFGNIDLSLWQDKLIPLGNLSAENSFFWKYLVRQCREHLYCTEKMLPCTQDMCDYLMKYMELCNREGLLTNGSIILQELLEITLQLEPEEAGRRDLLNVIQQLLRFKQLEIIHVKPLLELFYRHQLDNVERSFVEILQVLLDSQRNNGKVDVEDTKPIVSDAPCGDAARELKHKIGTLLHKRHQLQRQKEAGTLSDDLLLELDRIVAEVEETKGLVAKLGETEKRRGADAEADGEADGGEQQEGLPSQGQNEDYPAHALTFAFTALLVHLRHFHQVSNYTRNFYDFYVTKSICCAQESVRKLVLKLMALVGLCEKDDARKAMLVCVQALGFDGDDVQLTAFQCIFDLVLQFGIELFEGDVVFQEMWCKIKTELSGNALMLSDESSHMEMLIMHYIRSPNPSLVKVGVSGIIKLHLADRLCVPKMISALLVLWSNPANESTRTFQEISDWLPLFAKRGEVQALMLAQAVFPCVRKIVAARKNTALLADSAENLIAFVIDSTDQRRIGKCLRRPELPHERIAYDILQELSNIDIGTDLIPFGKGLKFLNLEGCHKATISDMIARVKKLLKISIRGVIPSLKAFLRTLKSLDHDESLVKRRESESDTSDGEAEVEAEAEGSVCSGRSSVGSNESSEMF